VSRVVIIGAGEFGLTAALALQRRGWSVVVIDPGPVPHPDAASTDISKVVRADYGADPIYTEMAEQSLEGWRAWNAAWGRELYHEDGFLLMSRDPLAAGGFEYESHAFLSARGHRLIRKTAADLHREHPAWNAERYPAGYLNPRAGWAESGKVMMQLVLEARHRCIEMVEGGRFEKLIEHDGRVTGVITHDGCEYLADCVLMAAGAWTPALLPWLQHAMWATGQIVMHFQPRDAEAYRAPQFPVWAADIGRTGWYGFPVTAAGIVKVANHGPGVRVDPHEPRIVPADAEDRFRGFLRDTFPALAQAPLVASRLCLYGDTFDGHFWIDHDPGHPGLVVAAGDSGHAFKFAPVLGDLIADVVERRPNPWARRFVWREPSAMSSEGARALGER